MRLIRLALLILVSGLSGLNAQSTGIDQPFNFVAPPTGGKFIEWYGKLGRSYFIQVSDATDHLNKWNWATVIERGNDEWISYEVDSTAEKAFFRLQYTDQTATNLDNADFDGDGLSNLQEITPSNYAQTNPLDPDTDHDGTNDLDEWYNQSNPTDPNSGGTPPGSDAGGAGNGSGGTGGNASGETGGSGNATSPLDDIKLVYRGVNYNKVKWYTDNQASVELHSASLLAKFAAKISGDTLGIKVAPYYTGSPDNETISAHPDSQTATSDYQKIYTYSASSPPTSTDTADSAFTINDASSELHGMFVDLVPLGDDLSTWKEAGKNYFRLGGSAQYTDMGADPLWSTSRSTAQYQFGIRADTTSIDVRHFKRDFLQVLTRQNEFTGLFTQSLANPPLISRIFDIDTGKKYSQYENINTPESEITGEYGVNKNLALVPVRIGDNVTATGIDITSRDTATSDIGHQPYYWIMAPAGKDRQEHRKNCNNAMQFKIPLPNGTRLKISCEGATPSPAIISPREDSEPTVAWHGVANESSEPTLVFKVGTEELVVDLPIRVKVMKNRTVKVKVHLVARDLGGGVGADPDPTMIPTKAELETYLNTLYAYQINTWFDVTIAPTTLVVPFNTDMTIGPEAHATDQATIAGLSGNLSESHINVFIIGKNGDLNGDSGATTSSQATCWILGRHSANNKYKTKDDLMATVGHEMGHVFFGDGHPNGSFTAQGVAPLLGTDHVKRLMCFGPLSNSSSRLIVKAEWDAAEIWLKKAENRLSMDP
jgi:hypothetical protein